MIIFFFSIVSFLLGVIIYKKKKESNSVLSNIIDSKVDQYNQKRETKDLKKMYISCPNGITQGRTINISPILKMSSNVDGMAIPKFDDSYIVGAVGQIQQDNNTLIQRAYLGDGDQTFLQFILDHDEVKEVMIFQKVLSVTPDEDGWDYLINDQDGMIGNKEATIKKDDGTEITYEREFDSGYDGRITPVSYKENIITEDGESITVDGNFILYSRAVGSETEFCIMQVTKVNDDTTADVYLGIKVPDETWVSVN